MHVRRSASTRSALAALFVGVLALCGGFGETAARAATATFSISLRPSVVAVVPGGSATTTLRLTRRTGFTSPVTLAYTASAGVTVALASRTAGAQTPINIRVAASARPANYAVTVRASSRGRTVSARLTVAVASPPPTAVTAAPTVAPTVAPTTAIAPTTAAPTTVAPTTAAPTTVVAATTTTEAADFTLGANPAAITVLPGAIATTSITITRTGGFKDVLELGATGLPPGVIVSFQPNPADGNTAAMAVSASGASQGVYPITVSSRSRSTKVTVTVGGDFQLAPNPATLTLAVGGTASTTIGITRSGGFAGPVTVAVSGAPEGLTAALDSPTASGPSGVLRISTAATLKTGSYNLTVTGTSGAVSRTTPVTVVVTPAPLALGINVSKASVVPGRTTTFALTIVRPTSDTSNSVASFSVAGLPPLASIVFAPPTSAAGSTATITTNANTPVGTYPLTFAATINGVVAANVAASLNVSPANVSFDLVPALASVSVPKGGTAIFTVGASWVGPTQPITFSISGLPNSIVPSYTLNPGPLGTTLFLTPSAATAAGTYPFVLTGTAGTFVNNQTLTLVVT